MFKDLEARLLALENEMHLLESSPCDSAGELRLKQLRRDCKELLESCRELTAEDKVYLARHPKRPNIRAYISALFTDFFEQKGDRLGKEDQSILCGIALYKGEPVTVIGHRKGSNLDENLRCNFGMPGPEGYRKALRAMKQAEKFGRPIVTLIDTPEPIPGWKRRPTARARPLPVIFMK